MAAKPKLSPEQWADVRKHWEGDPRDGYAWLVDELNLPVSAPGVRKTALRDNWTKAAPADGAASQSNPKPSPSKSASTAPSHKGGKPAAASSVETSIEAEGEKKTTAKVSRKNHAMVSKVSETMGETIREGEATPVVMVGDDPDQFGTLLQVTDKQEIFVREYMVDWNATQAAIRAGYSVESAGQLAYQLLQKPSVRSAIEALASARARRLGVDADELLRLWSSIVTMDANELSQHRRVSCHYCWGDGHQKQYTPAGLEKAQTAHERERERKLNASDGKEDIGDFPEYTDVWYDKRKGPHPDCPECFGDGLSETYFADTRTLSPAALALYGGVKEGRDGMEFIGMTKEKAMDNLARALGLFKEKEVEVNFNMATGDDLYRLYEDKMRIARERQATVLVERGMIEAQPSAPAGE